MKKLKYLVFFLLYVGFASCKQQAEFEENMQDKTPTFEHRKEFLSNLMDIGSYHIEEKKVKEDLANLLNSIRTSGEVRSVSGNGIPIIEKIYESSLQENEISIFSENDVSEFDGEKTRLFVYKLENEEKTGFAIASNDLRIGEVLAIVEEGEFKKDISDAPFLQLIAINMSAYIKTTINEWNEIKREKEKQRSIYEGMVTNKEWEYSNWKLLNGNLKNILKTKWNQTAPYNDIVERMGYKGCPAGCGPIAIAQIMAFHKTPKNSKRECYYEYIVDRIPELKNWDGTYNWEEMTKKEKADYLSNEGKLHIGALLYIIGKVGSASYSSDATGMSDSDARYCFERFGFEYGSFSSFSSYSYENISPMKRKGRIGRIGSGDRDRSRKLRIGPKSYDFNGIKVSIDHNAPVLVGGYAKKHVEKKSAWWWAWEWEEIKYKSGHYWVVDGYCRLFCKAKNKRTHEEKNITTDYVHCNVGWNGINNGYYINGLFTFNNPTANAEDYQIRSEYGSEMYYQYGIQAFYNVVPKEK